MLSSPGVRSCGALVSYRSYTTRGPLRFRHMPLGTALFLEMQHCSRYSRAQIELFMRP